METLDAFRVVSRCTLTREKPICRSNLTTFTNTSTTFKIHPQLCRRRRTDARHGRLQTTHLSAAASVPPKHRVRLSRQRAILLCQTQKTISPTVRRTGELPPAKEVLHEHHRVRAKVRAKRRQRARRCSSGAVQLAARAKVSRSRWACQRTTSMAAVRYDSAPMLRRLER